MLRAAEEHGGLVRADRAVVVQCVAVVTLVDVDLAQHGGVEHRPAVVVVQHVLGEVQPDAEHRDHVAQVGAVVRDVVVRHLEALVVVTCERGKPMDIDFATSLADRRRFIVLFYCSRSRRWIGVVWKWVKGIDIEVSNLHSIEVSTDDRMVNF